MGLASSPSIFSCKMFSNFTVKTQANTPFISRTREAHYPSLYLKPTNKTLLLKAHASSDFHSPLSNQPLIQRSFVSKNAGFSLVRYAGKNSAGSGEDHRALETVLKLYNAIKHRDLGELSDVIGDECRCVCNFVSFLHPLYGKKEVLEFFSFLMKSMGKHITFIVQPTLHDGMNVGISWKLEWDKVHVPLGKGFSFYTCHVYHGKMVIRNIEMFMEPLLHIEPLRLKMIGVVMSLSDTIGSHVRMKEKRWRIIYSSLTLVFIVALLFLLKCSFF